MMFLIPYLIGPLKKIISVLTGFSDDLFILYTAHPILTVTVIALTTLSLSFVVQILLSFTNYLILILLPSSFWASKGSILKLQLQEKNKAGKLVPSKKLRPWAVVTGASDGIGKEFALQLAHLGYNIVLISRSVDRLKLVADLISTQDPLSKTLILPVDYAAASTHDYDTIAAALRPLHITVLINNVGISHAFPISFVEETSDMVHSIVQVNIMAQLTMTRIILPQMLARKEGTIINVGSMAGKVPSAYLSVYSGSKAFLRFWSQALALEVKPSNIHVEHVNTYFVATAMSKIRKASWLAPSPKLYVQSVLANVGNSINSTPYPPHGFVSWMFERFAPEHLLMKLSCDMHLDIRKRALAKIAREAKKN